MRPTLLLALLAVAVPAVAAGCSDEKPDRAIGLSSDAPATGSETTSTDDTTPASRDGTVVTSTPSSAGAIVRPDGFGRVRATMTEPDGEVCELCLWLASNDDQRRRGLMSVTDLGPADGMAFVYPAPHTGNFWMKDTVLPLSIAFFGQDGGFLGSYDMEPCAADPCPLYRTEPDFVVAVETVQGELGELGLVSGGVLALTDLPCGD